MRKPLSFGLIGLLFVFAFHLYSAKPVNLQTAKEQACKLVDEGKFTEASALIDTLITENKRNSELPETLYWIAERYRWAHKWEDSKNLYQQIVQNYPDNPFTSRASLGTARTETLYLVALQDVNSSARSIDKMLMDYPDHEDMPETLYWIAREYGYGGLHEEEKQIYQKIVQHYPQSSFASKAALGAARAEIQLLVATGKLDETAISASRLKKDFSEHSDLQDALYWIGARYEWTGKREEAMEIYQEALNIDPNSSVADRARLSYSKANVLAHIAWTDYEDAKEVLDKMVKDYAGRSMPYEELEWIAEKYDVIGEANTAKTMFEKVFREYPAADEPAVLAKAHLNKNELISAIESGDKDKAQIIVQQMDSQLAGVSDKHDRLLLTVANDLYFRGRNIRKQNETKSNDYLVAAIQIFDSIIAKSNNGNYLADAYFLSGICYQETGNYEMAKGYYKTVSEKWPKSKYAREAKFRASKKVDEVYFNN